MTAIMLVNLIVFILSLYQRPRWLRGRHSITIGNWGHGYGVISIGARSCLFYENLARFETFFLKV